MDDKKPEDSNDDNEALMDHCALEMMHAIESKDKDAYRNAFQVLAADIMSKMQAESPEKEA